MGVTRATTRGLTRAMTRSLGPWPLVTDDGMLWSPNRLSSRVSLTRAADLWVPDASGFRQISAAQPWFNTDGALVLQPAGTNLCAYSTDPTRWNPDQLSIEATGETEVLGLFTPARLVCLTEWGSWEHATAATMPELVSGTTLGIELWVRPGTSGSFSVQTTNYNDLETVISGPIEGPYTTTGNDTATVTTTEVYAGIWRLRLLFESLVVGDPAWMLINVGHGSDTVDEYLEVLGAQVSSPAVFGSFIVTSGATGSRPADQLSYTPTETEDISLVGTAWDGTDYPEQTPLTLAAQSATLTFPEGIWSRARSTPAA